MGIVHGNNNSLDQRGKNGIGGVGADKRPTSQLEPTGLGGELEHRGS